MAQRVVFSMKAFVAVGRNALQRKERRSGLRIRIFGLLVALRTDKRHSVKSWCLHGSGRILPCPRSRPEAATWSSPHGMAPRSIQCSFQVIVLAIRCGLDTAVPRGAAIGYSFAWRGRGQAERGTFSADGRHDPRGHLDHLARTRKSFVHQPKF